MSDKDISLALQEREVLGKGLNKLRQQGLVPAVIHDHGKPSTHVMGEYQSIAKVYANAGKHHPVELTVGSKKNTAIIKDVHYDPVKHRVEHVVFQAIHQDEKVETEVPIVFVGEIPAEKAGLMVITHLSHVETEALPKDLPDELQLNTESLVEIGDKLTVADLVVPENVTVMSDPESLIVSVEETPAQVSEEAEEEEVEGEGEGGETSADEKTAPPEEE
jgi:large subunit ribosomal protein L25